MNQSHSFRTLSRWALFVFPANPRPEKGQNEMDVKEISDRRAETIANRSELIKAATSAGGFTDETRAKREEYNAAIASDSELIQAHEDDRASRMTAPPMHAGSTGRGLGWDVEDNLPDGDSPVMRQAYEAAAKPLFRNLGEQLLAVHGAEMSPYNIDPRLVPLGAALGAGSAIGADGGFLVQTDLETEIQRKMHDVGILRGLITFREIGPNSNGIKVPAVDETSRVDGSRFGGVSGSWVDQGTAPTASNPKFGMIELKLNKAAALAYATDELLADTTALGSFMTDALAEELAFLTENAFFRGTGAGQPLGILNAAALIQVAKETGQAAATIIRQNIQKMHARAWARSRRNAVWMINQDIEPALSEMRDDNNNLIYLPPGGLNDAPYGRLLGRPVLPLEYSATLGSVGDIVLGDWTQYYAIQKGGVEAATSMHVRFIQGEQAFRVTYRVDGQPRWKSALTPFQGTNTQSPFVALAVRA
jgi:HK97 family phage major capsid protein